MALYVGTLTAGERTSLERHLRLRTGSAGLARRAAIILRSAQREKVPDIAKGIQKGCRSPRFASGSGASQSRVQKG